MSDCSVARSMACFSATSCSTTYIISTFCEHTHISVKLSPYLNVFLHFFQFLQHLLANRERCQMLLLFFGQLRLGNRTERARPCLFKETPSYISKRNHRLQHKSHTIFLLDRKSVV